MTGRVTTGRARAGRARAAGVAAGLAGLAVALAGCGGSSDKLSDYYCPQPFSVQDVERLTHFKDGPGRDPRDIAYEASLAGIKTTCKANRTTIEVTLLVGISASAGPSIGSGPVGVPYFVRVLDSNGTIVQGQEFVAPVRLTPANPQTNVREELTLNLSRSGSYRIAVGLKPTSEELNYNRRGR